MTETKHVGTSIRVTCKPSADGESGPRLTSSCEVLRITEGHEFLRVEDDGFESEAHGRRARHLALCQFLPLIEGTGEFIPVIHDCSDALVVVATVPRSNVVPGLHNSPTLNSQFRSMMDYQAGVQK